jgi:hypothetical protein
MTPFMKFFVAVKPPPVLSGLAKDVPAPPLPHPSPQDSSRDWFLIDYRRNFDILQYLTLSKPVARRAYIKQGAVNVV